VHVISWSGDFRGASERDSIFSGACMSMFILQGHMYYLFSNCRTVSSAGDGSRVRSGRQSVRPVPSGSGAIL
jgi:hypothetical protein